MIRATVLLLNFKFSKPTTDVMSALILDFYGQVFNSVNVAAVVRPATSTSFGSWMSSVLEELRHLQFGARTFSSLWI
jgi:hypothetical protein